MHSGFVLKRDGAFEDNNLIFLHIGRRVAVVTTVHTRGGLQGEPAPSFWYLNSIV